MSVRTSLINMARPVIDEEEILAVQSVLRSGLLSQGEKVEEFEEAFASFTDTRFAVAVSSGTAALHIALLAHGIGNGDEVITTPFTFAATANAVLLSGARPVFADIDDATFNINPEEALKRITPRTKAIIPVHLYGQPCDIETLTDISNKHRLVLVEDACQAHGAEYSGSKVGSFGTGCFSFYPTKNMTTGEGGMLTTNDQDIADKARIIRSHGQKRRYYHETLGFNYRMTDIEAVIGICQLRKLPRLNAIRIKNAEFLNQNLEGIKGLITPRLKSGTRHVFHQYTVRVTEEFGLSRDAFKNELKSKGILTEVYYPIPIHWQPLYKNLGYDDHLPVSERAVQEVLSLPVHPSLTEEDLIDIVEVIKALAG